MAADVPTAVSVTSLNAFAIANPLRIHYRLFLAGCQPKAIARATASFDAAVCAKAVVAIVVLLVPAACVVAVTALDSDPPLIVGLVSVLLVKVCVPVRVVTVLSIATVSVLPEH